MMIEGDIRARWEKEQPDYEKMGKKITEEVQDLLKQIKIYGELSFRTKEIDSLIKKLYRKEKNYEEIHDKVGARAVVQFRNHIVLLDKSIREYFGNRIKKCEDKTLTLSEYEFGYQSIHYDIANEQEDMFCELQIRTVCQHNWSLLSHSLSYKKDANIPIEIKRQINALSALFEVADTQFQSISDKILSLPKTHDFAVMNYLETCFYSFCTKEYDHEMTNEFMQHLQSFYIDEDIMEKLSEFYTDNIDKIKHAISARRDNVFYTQPEILVILERITNKKILFKSRWSEMYPLDLLEEIANIWGTSLE